MTSDLVVAKVGGSLFGFDQMPDRVHSWLASYAPGVTVFIGGGGDLVQPLRSVHERFRMDEEVSHWLAIRAMTVTSRLLAKLLNVELVERFETIEQLAGTGRKTACVLDVEEFLRNREPSLPGCKLPWDWSCSSDSIAARVAEVLKSRELALLKSLPFPANLPLAKAVEQGLVDRHFPDAVSLIPRLRWVNIRDSDPANGVLLIDRS